MTTPPPVPQNESIRLARLRELMVLDSAPEPLFDDIARMASAVCGAPIALISLVDSDRQWFKANVGLPGVNETPRDIAFCAHAILGDGVFEVADALRDDRFADSPLVQGRPDIRFYAGAPLAMPEGERIGTLCVIDRDARQLDAVQTESLRALASIAVQALTMRRDLITKALTARSEYEQVLSVSEARHRALVESQAEFVSLARPDGEIVYANPAHARHFCPPATDMTDRNLFDFVHPHDVATVRRLIAAVLGGDGARAIENRMIAADGGERWVAWTHSRQAGEGGEPLLHSVGRDVTERVLADETLRRLTVESERQAATLRLIGEAIPATVVIVGAEGRYRFANGAFERYCGRTRDRIVGHTAEEVLGVDEMARRAPYMQRALAGETVHFTLDYPGPDGTTWLSLSAIPLSLNGAEVDSIVGISQDITRQRREQDRLTRLSQRDPLTGLFNRAGLEHSLAVQTDQGGGAHLGLLYIDLDHFKPVNDLHGHPAGDRLLQMVAQRLSGLVRPTDAVTRMGGDEFAILLVGVGTLANAEMVAAKVVAAMAGPFEFDGLVLQIGASVGVACGGPSAGHWQTLIAQADAMLYRAKQSGRGRYASGAGTTS